VLLARGTLAAAALRRWPSRVLDRRDARQIAAGDLVARPDHTLAAINPSDDNNQPARLTGHCRIQAGYRPRIPPLAPPTAITLAHPPIRTFAHLPISCLVQLPFALSPFAALARCCQLHAQFCARSAERRRLERQTNRASRTAVFLGLTSAAHDDSGLASQAGPERHAEIKRARSGLSAGEPSCIGCPAALPPLVAVCASLPPPGPRAGKGSAGLCAPSRAAELPQPHMLLTPIGSSCAIHRRSRRRTTPSDWISARSCARSYHVRLAR